jgi:penicillin-binding protein 1A
MMEGVVVRGTAGNAGFNREVGKPVAGKTGTTNEEKDAWFIGFTPDVVVGVYIGYDKPKPLGRGQTGGVVAAPIVKDFMKVALKDKPAVPFRVPPGIKLVRVDLNTGARARPGDQRVILEAFKPGTAPPDNYALVGYSDQGSGGGYPTPDGQRPWGAGVPADSDRAIRTGTGGLY